MKYTFNYTDRPSRAIMYWREQFILLATRTGGLVHPNNKLVGDFLNVLETLQNRVPTDPFGTPLCYLMLRGIWDDDAHGAMVLHVEQLYDISIKPVFTEEEIKQALHDGDSWWDGSATFVEVYTTQVLVGSDHFWPHLNEFYDKVKSSMNW